MSFGVQSVGIFGSSTQTDGSSSGSTSLRQFADLDLTEDQRKQIRSILKKADSDGTSQSDVQQEINAILTPAQQTALQSDLASLTGSTSAGTDSSTSSSNSSTSSTPASQSAPPPPGGNPFADPNGPFANLDLSSSQQSQIAQIIQNGQQQGLSIDQMNSQIDAILSTSQQATFASDLADMPPPPGSQNSSGTGSSTTDPLANLALTDDQKSQIETILQNAQSSGTSQSTVLAQIEAVLTPSQQSAFLQDVQTAQATVSGQSQYGYGGTSATSSTSTSSATLSNGVSETDIQNQVAAATSLLLQQFQYDVYGASATSST